jgi:hypothetical protein
MPRVLTPYGASFAPLCPSTKKQSAVQKSVAFSRGRGVCVKVSPRTARCCQKQQCVSKTNQYFYNLILQLCPQISILTPCITHTVLLSYCQAFCSSYDFLSTSCSCKNLNQLVTMTISQSSFNYKTHPIK